MSSKKSILTTLSEFKNEYYGLRGTAKREKLEASFESFKKEAAATVEPTDLFGAYRSDETADEIIKGIRSSRVSASCNESLDS